MSSKKRRALARQDTESRIYEAFLGLLHEKGYEGISVSDIINRSGVARSTFYRHFISVHDVLIHYGYYLAKRIKAESGDESPDFFDRAYLLRIFRSFQGLCSDFAIMDAAGVPTQLAELVVGYYEVELGTMLKSSPKRYSLYYHAGALSCVLLEWMNSGMSESPEEMADIFLKLTNGHPEDIA